MMEPFFVALGVTVAASFAYLVFSTSAAARARAWREAARVAGLTDLAPASLLGVETGLRGRAGSLRVSFERYQRGRHESGTRVVIDGLGHPSWEFALRKEGFGSALEKALGEREIEIGDPSFDERAYVQGASRLVRAILDADTRRLRGPLLDGRLATGEATPGEPLKTRVTVTDGALRADIPEPAFTPGGRRLSGAFLTLLEAARRLVLPADLPRRLADNAHRDPLPAVRLASPGRPRRRPPGTSSRRHEAERPW